MGKGSGSTRASSSGNPKGLTKPYEVNGVSYTEKEFLEKFTEPSQSKTIGGGDYKMEYNEANNAIILINKMKAPAKGETTRVALPGGYSATIRNLEPGYGKGGFLQSNIYNAEGEKMGGVSDHRERYGSNGMADFGTKKEALEAVKDAMASWIRIRMMGLKY